MRRALSLILAGLALAASPAAAAEPKPTLPPFSWAYQPVGVDERGLWMEADDLEREFRDSRLLVRDEALNSYIHGVLCRAVGEDRCKGVRLYIIRDPSFNASMAANGMMQINTGLLLRLHSEAELAAAIAHEFGHFELRHTLEAFKRRRRSTDALMWAGITGGRNGANLQLAIIGSFFRFKREEEIAADIRSFEYLAASTYRAAASPAIWERMMAEYEASAAARKLKFRNARRPSFVDSHPTDMQRMVYLKALAAEHGDGGEDGVDGYAKALAAWRPQFLADAIKLNDFGGSEYILAELARSGWTKELLAARGDLYRLRGNPRDLTVAAQAYRDAIAQGATDPAIHRDLGMVLLRSGARADAATALQRYLALRPDAADKTMVALLIDQAGATSGAAVMHAESGAPAVSPGSPANAPPEPASGGSAVAGARALAPANDGSTK
jgi:predicted Zn-dependent protease